MRRVLVTGAEGVIGSAVRGHLADRYELVSFTRDVRRIPERESATSPASSRSMPAFEGVAAVVHLAAAASVESSWDDVLRDNIAGTRNVFEAARLAGVETIVYASSNHAVGRWELEHAPGLYSLDDPLRLDEWRSCGRTRCTGCRRPSARRSVATTRKRSG